MATSEVASHSTYRKWLPVHHSDPSGFWTTGLSLVITIVVSQDEELGSILIQ
jgi:hypothetical protein